MNNNMVGISIYQCISANISHTNAYQVYFNRGNSYVLIHVHQCLRTHCALTASGLQFNQLLPYPLRFRQSRYSARSSSVGSVMPWLRLKWQASRYSLSSIDIGPNIRKTPNLRLIFRLIVLFRLIFRLIAEREITSLRTPSEFVDWATEHLKHFNLKCGHGFNLGLRTGPRPVFGHSIPEQCPSMNLTGKMALAAAVMTPVGRVQCSN
jgi:hypothetical protein